MQPIIRKVSGEPGIKAKAKGIRSPTSGKCRKGLPMMASGTVAVAGDGVRDS